jgi:thiamine biosynthesis lipoprotein
MKKLLLILPILLMLSTSGCSSLNTLSDAPAERQVYAMDTIMSLTVYGDNKDEVIDKAENKINEIDAELDRSNTNSEVYKLNTDKVAEVSEDTADIIATAQDISRSSDGAFDITIAPVMDLWGFYGQDYHLPDKSDLEKALKEVDYNNISVSENTVSVDNNSTIDLGGIAKGYTSDKLSALFKENGITSALVSLGGNVQATGCKPNGEKWRVAIQDPDDSNGYLGILSLEDNAAVTSGGYQRFFEQDGVKYHHIIDPKTGYPSQSGVKSVTIISPSGIQADGLSTTLFVLGLEKSTELWKTGKYDFGFVIETDDNTLYVTENISDIFESDKNLIILSK